MRGTAIVLLIVLATLLAFEFSGREAGAQATGNIAQVLSNQQQILEKLDAIDRKLDQLKMRIRI